MGDWGLKDPGSGALVTRLLMLQFRTLRAWGCHGLGFRV